MTGQHRKPVAASRRRRLDLYGYSLLVITLILIGSFSSFLIFIWDSRLKQPQAVVIQEPIPEQMADKPKYDFYTPSTKEEKTDSKKKVTDNNKKLADKKEKRSSTNKKQVDN